MPKKLVKSEVLEKFHVIHNGKYDYSLFDYNLENNRTEIYPICPKHGKFKVTVANHLRGKGCPKCCGKNFTNIEKIEKARIIHSDKYDYSQSDFTNSRVKTKIKCPTHGEFLMDYDHHVNNKNGCPMCSGKQKLTTEAFIERAKLVYGDRYDYSMIEYKNMHNYIYPICKEHGVFKIQAQAHLKGQGCQKCKTTTLEEIVFNALKLNEIEFVYQANKSIFPWLGHLSLDFYIPSKNVAIECQGKQHFWQGGWTQNISKRTEYFQTQSNRDENKFKLCRDNGIEVLYFSNMTPNYPYFSEVYTQINNLIKIIKNIN